MNVTHKITMDLTRPTNGNGINVVEGDKNSRIVNVHLYENSVSWRVPTDASVLIKWERESGVGGEYSQLSDGSSAWSAVGNILTITLSEESTEYSGNVKFSIVLTSGDSQISTFVIVANVHAVANGREGANSGASSTDIAGLQKQIGNLSDLETKNKSNLVAAINEAAKSGGGSGETGADGGYYTPKVSQPAAATMQMAFTPSKAGMPAVEPVTINLPVGSDSSQNLNLTVETVTIGDDSGEPENVPVTGLSLGLTSYSAKVGDGFYINPVVSPSNATNKVVTWKSSATNIATVNNSGYVECITEGNAVITCTTVDGGFTATCAVSVSAGESGGDDSGGGDTTGGKVYFKDSPYTLVEGSLMKPNGTTGAISHTGHLAIPYTDGITIATCMNPSWNTNTYPHFVVLDNGVYSAVNGEATGEMATTAANQFVATFTGYGAGAVIYANMNRVDYMKKDENTSSGFDSTTFYYYTIPGGES